MKALQVVFTARMLLLNRRREIHSEFGYARMVHEAVMNAFIPTLDAEGSDYATDRLRQQFTKLRPTLS